ncbi:thiamine pyrophosphate-binding protein [Saxibacter everestensis]|uniref:Thiamine pyrophosphate-binding protein n=1 Tax=Saxibacter everestensis TaxID=2909229 RepID=A0ABY8QRQ6_9MICO|nr:thiamine pyrophosphate-binding protein [Brevibacteriaceae bacterium ZFBP1038]
MKTYQAVLEYLESTGVRHFAGMVGSTSAPYVVGVAASSQARYIPVRHEQVAAAIIDATGRLDRKPGCLLVHGASGALAASLGIAAAARDSVPMLVLSATQERIAMERSYWQTQDVLRPMSAFVKWQTRVERPDHAVAAVRTALRAAVSGKPGVAQVDLPIDVSTAEFDGEPIMEKPERDAYRVWPDPTAVVEAASLVGKARRLVILVGGGAVAAGAADAITTLAEKLHAPVVNTPTSRGVIAEDHELSFGPSGILGYAPADRVVSEADTVLAIGSRISDLQTARGTLLASEAVVIQVDIEPTSLAKERPITLEIVSDAGTFTHQLLQQPGIAEPSVPASRYEWVASLSRNRQEWFEAWLASDGGSSLVQPTEIINELIRQAPRDAIFTHGAGDHGFYGYAVPVREPGTHLVSAALGALGCALGYAMGAKLARPEQTVIACVGDGEFMLQLGDLETMVRENLPAVVIVFNNFSLGSQRKRLELYGEPFGVEHGNPDFARLAELFGADGYRIDKPGQVAETLAAALDSGRPTVIDVIVDPAARPPRIAISREAH